MDDNVKKGIEMMQGYLNDFAQNSKKLFLCQNCTHKNVCKKVEEQDKECADFSDATTYQRYSSIYHFFQPIFDWMKFHYPAGEVKFIVDHNSAKMMLEHGIFVASKELKQPLADIFANYGNQNINIESKSEQQEDNTIPKPTE